MYNYIRFPFTVLSNKIRKEISYIIETYIYVM